MRWRHVKYTATALVVTGFLGSAAVVGQNRQVLSKVLDGSIEEHAEQVFGYQNRVSAALMESISKLEQYAASGVREIYDSDEFYALEDSLNAACDALQEIGYRQSEGEEVDRLDEIWAVVSLENCQQEAQKVEYFVWLADRDAANAFLGDNYLSSVVGYHQ